MNDALRTLSTLMIYIIPINTHCLLSDTDKFGELYPWTLHPHCDQSWQKLQWKNTPIPWPASPLDLCSLASHLPSHIYFQPELKEVCPYLTPVFVSPLKLVSTTQKAFQMMTVRWWNTPTHNHDTSHRTLSLVQKTSWIYDIQMNCCYAVNIYYSSIVVHCCWAMLSMKNIVYELQRKCSLPYNIIATDHTYDILFHCSRLG